MNADQVRALVAAKWPNALQAPEKRKVRGSYFPAIPTKVTYDVSTVSGEVVYSGHSIYVARLILAALTPRTF